MPKPKANNIDKSFKCFIFVFTTAAAEAAMEEDEKEKMAQRTPRSTGSSKVSPCSHRERLAVLGHLR